LFLSNVEEALGSQPNHQVWQEIGLPGRTVLEVGPGSGHLLAAAAEDGRAVWGLESSEVHRQAIHARWGIDTVVGSPEELPPQLRFDVIVAINVVEHVYEMQSFLAGLRDRLTDAGSIFISTVNAQSAVASLVRTRWSMFREPDHVSFPSPKGLRLSALAASLRPARIWSSELPFETFVSLAVAARDSRREQGVDLTKDSQGHKLEEIAEMHGHAGRSVVRRLYRYGRVVDPSSRLIGRVGRAGTVKALLQRN